VDVLKATSVTLLALPTEGRGSARGYGPQRFPLRNGARVRSEERCAASPDDRAEIVLGAHVDQSGGRSRVSS
jgi:hypothetical protein